MRCCTVLTIGTTLGLVYGLAVFVYEYGMLGWIGIDGLKEAQGSAICWMTPGACIVTRAMISTITTCACTYLMAWQ